MRIVYAKHYPPFVWEDGADSEFEGVDMGGRVLFFDPVYERFGNPSIAQRLRSVDPMYRDVDTLVVRGHGEEFADALSSELEVIRQIAPAVKGVYGLIGGTGDGITNLIRVDEANYLDLRQFIPKLRQIEIEGIIVRTGALFSDPKGHYLHPSRVHANAFLRFADALQDPIEVLRLSEWLTPHLSSKSGVLIGDSGSLIALLLTCQMFAQRLFGSLVEFRTLASYPQSSEEVEFVLDDVLSRQPDAEIVFVISVNSSGKLVDAIRKVAPANAKTIVVVDTSARPLPEGVDRLSSIPIQLFHVGIDGKCDSCYDRQLIAIDPRTYERIPYFEFNRAKIDLHVAGRDRDFWTAADEADAVHVHFDRAGNDGLIRHHAVYIDIGKLLQHPWFRAKAKEKLLALPQPNLVIVSDHSSIQPVLALIEDAYGAIKSERVVSGRFSGDTIRAIQSVPDSGCILVADDGLVEGTTLRGLKHEYYRVMQATNRQGPHLEAFVCLARPETEAVLVNASRPYRDGSGAHLAFGYKVLLPGSGSGKCPWCQEEAYLLRLSARVSTDLRQSISRRLLALAPRDFVPPFFDSSSAANDVKTVGAFYGNLGKKAAFAASSSSALTIRGILVEESRFNVTSLLDVRMALACYFDCPLIAGILRTLDGKHLHAATYENEVVEDLLRFPTDRAYPGLIGEFAWAAINRKLPTEPVQWLLDRVVQSEDVILLRQLLDLK